MTTKIPPSKQELILQLLTLPTDNLSQRDIAEIAGADRQTIKQLKESDQYKDRVKLEFERLLQALKPSIDGLIRSGELFDDLLRYVQGQSLINPVPNLPEGERYTDLLNLLSRNVGVILKTKGILPSGSTRSIHLDMSDQRQVNVINPTVMQLLQDGLTRSISSQGTEEPDYIDQIDSNV